MTTRLFARRLAGALILSLSCASAASAQAKIQIDPDRWVSLGGGLRTTFRSTETAGDDGEYVQKVLLDSTRLYINAAPHKNFEVELTTEYGGATSELRVLDAVVKYVANPYFNVWMGRHLPPSDRANLDGPYFLSAYDYPGLVSRYPGIFAGRDNGVSVSGQVNGGAFKYAGGVYDGSPSVDGAKDTMLYASRVVVNLLDPEPGYYNSSSYYGDKDVLAIGFVAQHQAGVVDMVDMVGKAESFNGWNGDLLFEKKLPDSGVVTFEGAYYDYDLKGMPGDGSAYLAQAGYLFPTMVGIGKLQPQVRYQSFRDDSVVDAALNYIIRGHSARVSAIYSRTTTEGVGKSNQLTVGAQFQF